jgi:hypothetical protein
LTGAGKTKARSKKIQPKKIQRIAKGAHMSRKTSAIATIAKAVPARLQGAGKTAKRLGTRALRVTKDNPGRSLVGAFAAGVVLAKMSRFV